MLVTGPRADGSVACAMHAKVSHRGRARYAAVRSMGAVALKCAARRSVLLACFYCWLGECDYNSHLPIKNTMPSVRLLARAPHRPLLPRGLSGGWSITRHYNVCVYEYSGRRPQSRACSDHCRPFERERVPRESPRRPRRAPARKSDAMAVVFEDHGQDAGHDGEAPEPDGHEKERTHH